MAYMGFKIIMLAAMGLGALYMMHLLAQDFIKIRQPIRMIARALIRSKRDSANETISDSSTELLKKGVDWDKILKRDPFNCLKSLICQIVSGSEADSTEAKNIRAFIEFSYSFAPEEIRSAYNRGFMFRKKSEMCFDEYPFCVYSARTMLKILKFFTVYLN